MRPKKFGSRIRAAQASRCVLLIILALWLIGFIITNAYIWLWR
jgi:hypothetical protein